MAKNIKNDSIQFIGENANDVTGSMIYITFNGKKILLECGMWQSNSFLESYNVNSKKFKFKPYEIDYCFINHVHIDHIGLLPRLVKEGFKGSIITTSTTALFMKDLLLNSSYILGDVARKLSKKYERKYQPLYTDDDVYRTLDYVYEFDNTNKIYKLDDTVSFQWFDNSHCLGARQLQLILTDDMKTKKILYTSDIGSLNSKNHYVKETQIIESFNDYVILESTYGERKRLNKKTRDYDINLLKSACLTTLERNGKVLLPAFSFSRTQELMTILYELFHNNKSFTYKIVVDSQLTCDICDDYNLALYGKDLELWKNVCSWDNFVFIKEKPKSQLSVKDTMPKIVISSSGFCTNGRVVNYLQEYLADKRNSIIFSGYVGSDETYLSYKIKNCESHKKIKINKVVIDNNADCYSLASCSSHATRDDLLNIGSNLNTTQLILVHGSSNAKVQLKEDLVTLISKNNKSYKVTVSNKDMVIHM